MRKVKAFLSHAHRQRSAAGRFKKKLEPDGISVFVAHDDLEGGTEWMSKLDEEIKECKVFIVLLSKFYHGSNFTDQELGMALAYEKPIIPICIDSTMPYGFMSKHQCVKSNLKFSNLEKIKNLILQYDDAGKEFVDLLISRLEMAASYIEAHKYACQILRQGKLTKEQTVRVLNAYDNNPEIYESFKAKPVVENILRQNKEYLGRQIHNRLIQ